MSMVFQGFTVDGPGRLLLQVVGALSLWEIMGFLNKIGCLAKNSSESFIV